MNEFKCLLGCEIAFIEIIAYQRGLGEQILNNHIDFIQKNRQNSIYFVHFVVFGIISFKKNNK